jgi:alpha-glucosidase
MFAEGRPVSYRSEAIAKHDWATTARLHLSAEAFTFDAGACAAHVKLDPVRVHFAANGREFAADDTELGMGFMALEAPVDPLGAPAAVFKRHIPGTRYFGCGERTGGLEKTGTHQVFWNVDPPTQHTASLNNLYTSVPFVLALHNGQAWGMFVDSSYRQEFDLASTDASRCGFATDGGPLVYYVFSGPTPRAVLERYTELTGRMPMPPRWGLGNHQSRWGYKSADELLQLARTFRERDIPLDAVYLDIDYMRGYRVFTWDPERFPDPSELTAQLQELGVKLVTIIDPGVKVDDDYEVYSSGKQADLFCKTFSGNEYHNVVWPGMCAFPDFTNPRTRRWWGNHLPALMDKGVAGIWCDMNEPTVFVPTPNSLPDDVAHTGDGEALLHAQVHNVYGQLMARATYDGLQTHKPHQRPFVISRSGFAGLQRYALHWTGDNSSWWEHLWMSMPQLQNLGLSGYAFVGVDIGGFSGDATGELLTRWTEFGIFQPFCRNHSAWNTRRQEPWAFGEPYESHMRALLKLRQYLQPYLYTLFEEAHRTGAPILRPLLFEYPEDTTTYTADDEFLLGSSILVAPIARPGTEYRHVYLPAGTWVHFWSGERHVGPAHILIRAPLGEPAVFFRANTPIPTSQGWLVHVANGAEGAGGVYEDDGDGFAFLNGGFSRTHVTCRLSAGSIELEFSAEGEGRYARANTTLELRGLERPTRVVVDGVDRTDWDHTNGRLTVRTDSPRGVTIAAALTMDAV